MQPKPKRATNSQTIMETKSADLVIVYDKYTEEIANGISGKLAGKYTCLVQSNKVFESKKNSYTNNNKILFLSENLIGQYMSMSDVSDYAIDTLDNGKSKIYFYLYSLGNWRGIWIDMEKTAKSLPRKFRNDWYFYRYFGDYYCYPFLGRKMSKDLFDSVCYEEVVRFLLKEENIKLLITD